MSCPGLELSTMLAVLGDARSVTDLRRYFGVGLPQGVLPPLTGGRFELLGGGGDLPTNRDVITPTDLIAVEMLSVRIPPRVSLDLLEGDLGRQVSTFLRAIPTDVLLGSDEAAEHIEDDSAADAAFGLLRAQPGVDWVITGKLLARKRPQLIPVYDRVVRCAYRTGEGFWKWQHCRLREEGGALGARLAALRAEAGVPQEVSLLRILDVVFWMRHRDGHTDSGCGGLGT
jgi:hypothetical protein